MPRIAVVGATGAVGRERLALLDGGIVPVEQVVPVGSARSVGRDLGTELAPSLPMADLVTLDELDPRGLDVAIFSEAAHLRLREPVTTASVEEAMAATPGLRVHGRPESPSYPMPRTVFARPEDRALVHVGRIRVEPQDDRAAALRVVADNLWVGAALNALQIVELAAKNGWLG
jgi:aspartate-semialdehyde dehydrogenase